MRTENEMLGVTVERGRQLRRRRHLCRYGTAAVGVVLAAATLWLVPKANHDQHIRVASTGVATVSTTTTEHGAQVVTPVTTKSTTTSTSAAATSTTSTAKTASSVATSAKTTPSSAPVTAPLATTSSSAPEYIPTPSTVCGSTSTAQATREFFETFDSGDMTKLDSLTAPSGDFAFASFALPYGTDRAQYTRTYALDRLKAIYEGGVRVDVDTITDHGTYGDTGVIKLDFKCGKLHSIAWLRY